MNENQPPDSDKRQDWAEPHSTLCPTRDQRVGEDGIDAGSNQWCICGTRNDAVER